ncbi:MAG: hypothetical protein AB8B36_04025 [Prochlorococcus sp.]
MQNVSSSNILDSMKYAKRYWLPLFLLGIVLLTGCRQRGSAISIYVGISNYKKEDLNESGFKQAKEAEEQLMRTANLHLDSLHPGADATIYYYPNRDLVDIISRRSAYGLGPDLIVSSETVAEELYAKGLVKSFVMEKAHTVGPMNKIEQLYFESNGKRIALPIMLDSQLACGNRKLIQSMPQTFDEWLKFKDPVSFSIPVRDQFWLYGVFGAGEAIMRAVASNLEPFSDQESAAFAEYLKTIRAEFLGLELHQMDHHKMLLGLEEGLLAWTTCRTSDIPRLSQSLGEDLLTSPLPKGSYGVPISMPIIRTATIGVHSTQRQTLLAKDWLKYWLQPIEQRILRQTFLRPLNRQSRADIEEAEGRAIQAIVNAFQASPHPRAVVTAILGPRSKGDALMVKLFYQYWNEQIEAQSLQENMIDAFAIQR